MSCTILLCEILYPWASIEYVDHIILAIASSTPISYPSAEIFSSIFYFLEKLETDPLPRDIIYPMCPRQSSCTAYEASIHHFNTEMSPFLKVSFSYIIPLIYFNTRFSFPQFSSSGYFTHVVRNVTYVCMYQRALELMNSTCTTLLWKICAW